LRTGIGEFFSSPFTHDIFAAHLDLESACNWSTLA
jgi:hypothetical protein